MSRWTQMIRKLFTAPPPCAEDQYKARTRRPKPTTKPTLESVEDRIVPSAASMAPQVVQEWGQVMATVRQDVNSVVSIIEQDIAQEEAYFVQQWENFFGIPTAPNPALGSTGQQPDNGAASGTTAAHTSGNQAPASDTKQVGRGSGSGAAITARDSLPTHGVSKIQPLDGNDVYSWKPWVSVGSGSSGGGQTYNASDPRNWLKNDQQQDAFGNRPGNKATDIVEFDGGNDKPITWDYSATFSTMQLGTSDGQTYDQTQTLKNNVELDGMDGGTSLIVIVPTSWLKLNYQSNYNFQIDKNATITNMALSGVPSGQFTINGGTTNIAQQSSGTPYQDTIGVQVYINSGATLNDESYNSLKFTNSNLAITINGNGTMKTYYGPGGGITLIDNNNMSNDYINVNGGTLGYYGSKGVTDTFTVPVYVQNSGTFRVSVSNGQPDGSKLVVKDSSGYLFPTSSKESVYMTGSSSSVQLAHAATLECTDDYYQDSGTLETTDGTTCTLVDSSTGATATIAGGSVWIASPQNTYGTLKVTGNLTFNGQLIVSIQGYAPNGNPGTSDLLYVSNTLTLNRGSSTLSVFNYGQLQKVGNNADFWFVIQAGNNILNDFSSESTNPAANLTYGPPNNPAGKYKITYNG